MMLKELLEDGEERMGKAVEALAHDYRAVRTGRANPALLEKITIDYYGVRTPVQQVAGVTAQEGRMLLIKPWDKTALRAIERAILESDLGINPNNDGEVIRLILPALNNERRQALVKQIHKRAEEARIAIRNIRRDVIKDLEDAEKESMISEDDLKRGKEKLQNITDDHTKRVDSVMKEKEEEIMEV
jgi:ribosome recycling factor